MEQKISSLWQSRLRTALPTIVIVALFALISLVYFSPAVFEGRELFQQDVAGASGTAQDVRDHYDATGETSYWTNSLFGGMPMYQISPSYPSLSTLKHAQDLYTLQWPLSLLPSYSWLLFAMLVGFFVFMRSLSLGRWTAMLGAVMWAFSSYFIILIDAGHIWKLTVLAFIPPTIAGIVWTYRGRYLLGGVVTAFFATLQLMSNHIQMSYYFAFLIVFILIAFLVEALREKQVKRFLIATAVTAAAGLISIGANSSNLYHTYEYTQETMRGGSALNASASGVANKSVGGLDKAYITQWSYGKAETLTLLIPNTYGGATGYIGSNPELMQDVPLPLRQYVGQMNQYWGDQPFTSGPVYVGAFVMFLFILGLFIVRTPLKWALVAGTALSVALSWGHNMMWLTDLFIDYFPLYNKFRTVSSILVVAEFTIPTLAVLALVEFIRRPKAVLAERVALITSLSLTAGICLVVALAPSAFFGFLSAQENEMFRAALLDNPAVSEVLTQLKYVRASIASADAWRSLLVIVLSLGVCYIYSIGKLSKAATLGLIIGITFVDLWLVDKRYLNDGKFIDFKQVELQARPVTDVDRAIAQDTDPHYRVLNTSVGTFQDATTSYMHRSVGGYHAAKLSRYQDLIEHQISQGNRAVLNMLDVRYIISADQKAGLFYTRNHEALGAAWFVDSLRIVESASAEMSTLDDFDPATTAILEQEQAKALGLSSGQAGQSSVRLLSYQPNKASYEVSTDRERLLVFSEIYYPHGWSLTIDGEPAEIVRANYALRAAKVPAGAHRLEMTFDPKSIHITEWISITAQLLLLLGAILAIGLPLWRRSRATTEQ
ncbi:YfhO family protein [Porphyromonas sp. COT-290 OH3588]|uniref:YfhO family protein n=1 Tax=Porphyromonas sp. COT-290 OH3588 TaxID=1515617 RepID=UPI0005C76492|nr:YfhO family protein [Porphyromonas sp. COT-290 OH3588]